MKVYASLSKAARQARFIATGVEYPDVLTLDVPVSALSPTAREQLATFVNLADHPTTALTLPPTTHYAAPRALPQVWPLPSLPETPAEWETLISQYTASLAVYWAAQQERRQEEVTKALADLASGSLFYAAKITTAHAQCAGYAEVLTGIRSVEAERIARDAAEKAAQAARQEREAQARQEREQIAATAKAAAEAQKAAWIAAHGSVHLRQAVGAGYDCQRKYVSERAAAEFPGYVVDFADKAGWRSRSCPSVAALDEALRVSGQVVWLTRNEEGIEDERDLFFRPCEAVIVKFLDRYDLIKTF